MKSKTCILSVFVLAVVFSSSVTSAQTSEEGKNAQLYLFWDVVVHPSNVAAFEEATKKEVELYRKYDFPYPWSTSSTNDGHYYFGIPIDDYGTVDKVLEAFEETAKKMGDENTALEAAFEGTIESQQMQVWSLDYGLSHYPENARLEPKEETYTEWMFVYYKPGTESEVEKIAKKWKALYESKNLNDRYSVWVGDLGTEMPVHCYVEGGKSTVDYYTRLSEVEKLLGEDVEALWKETAKLIRKTEHRTGRSRPDLSLVAFSERQPTQQQ
jgi:hypothetical protein